MTSHPYEAIVVGSGATGGMAALTLAESGVRVLVVEAGPMYTPEEAYGSEPLNTARRLKNIITGEKRIQANHPGFWKNNPLLYMNEIENPYITNKDEPFIWTQGRQVGGRSLTWGGITLRLSENDFKQTNSDGGGPNWPIQYKDLESHYSRIESVLQVHGNKDNLNEVPDGEYIDPLPFNSDEKKFIQTVKQRVNCPIIHSRGFGARETKVKSEWPKSSSLGSTLKKAIKTGKVEILPNHIVQNILFERDLESASGVITINRINGQRKELKASLIVICTSTIQTIKLLLNSKEGQQERGFIEPSGLLGKNLMDHVSTCRFFTIEKQKDSEQNVSSENEKYLSGAGSFLIPYGTSIHTGEKNDFVGGYGLWGCINRFEPPDYLKKYPDKSTGFLIGHGEVLPNTKNQITLSNNKDKWGIPIPKIKFKWRNNEKNMIRHMQKNMKEIISASGGDIHPISEIINLPCVKVLTDTSYAFSEDSPPPGYYIHEVGGAPMGNSEELSVVDKWNRLWRCSNVLIVDGACWPTSSWQSPTLTMMAITRRACINAFNPQNE